MKNKPINESNPKTPPLGSDSTPKHGPFREKSKIHKRGERGIIHQNEKNPPTGKRSLKTPPFKNDSCQKGRAFPSKTQSTQKPL